MTYNQFCLSDYFELPIIREESKKSNNNNIIVIKF